LSGIVGHQAQLRDAEIVQDRDRGRVVARIDGQPEFAIGANRIVAEVLQRIGAQLVDEPDAAALVAAHVDDGAGAVGRDRFEREFELRLAVAAQRAEHLAGQTFGMDANQRRRRQGQLAVDQRDLFESAGADS
jgi:hypothetical protein